MHGGDFEVGSSIEGRKPVLVSYMNEQRGIFKIKDLYVVSKSLINVKYFNLIFFKKNQVWK